MRTEHFPFPTEDQCIVLEPCWGLMLPPTHLYANQQLATFPPFMYDIPPAPRTSLYWHPMPRTGRPIHSLQSSGSLPPPLLGP